MDFSIIERNLPFLWEGLQLSFLLAVIGILGGMLLGTVLAIIRMSRAKLLARCVTYYVNGCRCVPLVLVVFWFYFLVPLVLGRPVGAFWSVTIAFVMFEGAFYSEIMRAGVQSLSRGQMQAALATGLSRWGAMRHVILPQAFRHMAPVLVTQAIVLFQDTSLVYVVTLRDFMTSTSIVATRDHRLVEMYVFAALVYFVICFAGSMGASAMRRKFS